MKANVYIKDIYATLKVIDTTRFKNRFAIIADIIEGQIFVGDFIEVKINNKSHLFQVEAIFLYDYVPVSVAFQGERVIIPLFARPVKVNTDVDVKAYRDYVPYIASLGMVKHVGVNKKLTESHIVNLVNHKPTLFEFTIMMIREGIFDDLVSKGLKVLMTPVKAGAGLVWDNKKGISIVVALGIIAKKLWDKFSDPCNRPFRKKEEKLRCLQQAAQRVADELRREQASCLQLTDPVQKRKCLMKVEKLRRQWIQKSAEWKTELMAPK